MTVTQLIELLHQQPPGADVVMWDTSTVTTKPGPNYVAPGELQPLAYLRPYLAGVRVVEALPDALQPQESVRLGVWR